MNRYILEKDLSMQADGQAVRRWKVVEREKRLELATLTRSGAMFLAESDRFRTSAESADPFLAIRTVLRTDDIWIEQDGILRRLQRSDLE